ncbi:kinesin-like protein KIF25 [Dipodomys merriami]|uniref:kinesin-like protein KIF25 n=1 Tax=Dipodomys merriami TaxID=94247 RepID=UPI003855F7ED
MRPGGGAVEVRGFWEKRAKQLQHQVQVKEERIVELETENAVLHLKLAEYQERISRSSHREAELSRHRRVLTQLRHLTQTLKQDVHACRASSQRLLSDCRDQLRAGFSDVAAAVRSVHVSGEALQACRLKTTHLEQSLRDLGARLLQEQQRRRSLHNRLVELKGNIRVHCRIRPLLPFDKESDRETSGKSSNPGEEAARALDEETVSVTWCRPGQPASSRTYTFERVYGPAASQAAVFGDVRPLLTSLLDGYNVCIMAYGQTGSGKSYTMLGPRAVDWPALPPDAPRDPGVIPRAAEELFRLIAENPPRSPKVEVSIVEIYNNDIYDLLAKDGCTAVTGVRRGVVTTPEGRTEVPLLTCVTVTSAVEFVGLVHGGLQLRVTHPTLVHADSSRSHLVVTATLTTAAVPGSTGPPPGPATRPEPAAPERRQRVLQRVLPRCGLASVPGRGGRAQARLQLVDLAGSECVGASGVTGVALREASSINRSLAALADVLGALSEGRSHVPYRNSKLTRLLQDSIGGDAKLLLLLCVSPGRRHAADTLQSLGFGARARQARRGGARRRPPCSPDGGVSPSGRAPRSVPRRARGPEK